MNTIRESLTLCGVDDILLFQGQTAAERVSIAMFDDDYQTCIDKTLQELEDDFKDFSALTIQAGRLRFDPTTKRNIKAFLYWCKDKYRLNEDPEMEDFTPEQSLTIIRKAKTHKAYMEKSKTISDTATPSQFTDKVKWIDWLPTFKNFLKAIPRQNGVPLSYVIRNEPVIPPEIYVNFLDEYVDRAPLNGAAFITDSAEVHTYLVKFISENDTAESKIQTNAAQNNGQLDYP